MIREMLEDWPNRIFLIFIFLLIACIPVFVYLVIQENKEWQEFKLEHHCKVVAHISGTTAVGIVPMMGGNGGVGISITPIPGKTGWLCDDGVTYYK
jgi:hypothetical protein